MGEKRNAYRGWVGKPKRNMQVGPRRRYEDNVKTDLTEIGWQYGLDLSDSVKSK
jgi:hypothetical protein